MEPSSVDRALEEWKAVASEARRPAAPPRRLAIRSGLSTSTLAGASIAVAALVVALLWLGGRGPSGLVGGTPSIPADPTATPVATPSTDPTVGPCDPESLSARVTLWEGAAGHRIAHVELRNVGSDPCDLESAARPQLVDGEGSVLIDGANSPTSFIIVPPGGVVTTLVQAGNYCGPAPLAPVTVAFALADGGSIVAAPFSPTDATVPPCLGAGSPATIEMQPWAP